MPPDNGATSEVKLSRLNFSDWRANEGKNEGPRSTPQPAANTSILAHNFPAINSLPYDIRRPEAYERMDADKPGEELAHDAAIWRMYLEEADDFDQELVKSRHASLDMLLLFAALFSAILTAFLIESKDLLQQDPGDVSATLLLTIAQSQQRIELGLPAPETNNTIEFPAFSPSPSARWINGIWFSSLALSLSTALIAMLSKEWLTAYLSSRPRPAHDHVLLRQSRIEGLERWWALHIIALLPSLLHMSLLLFSVGLVIYLWSLDVAVAAVIAGVTGLTVLFYASTAFLGALNQFCPYVTQASGYIKAAREAYWSNSKSEEGQHSLYTSLNDLKALLWLANNARDPAVVDCSYQALSGLRVFPGPSQSTVSHAFGDQPPLSGSSWLEDALLQSNQDISPRSLFMAVCERFARLMRNRNELSTSSWTNAARYAKALVELSGHLGKQGPKMYAQFDGSDQANSHEVNSLKGPVLEVLATLDSLWNSDAPSLSAEIYASLVSGELALLCLAFPNNLPQARLSPKTVLPTSLDFYDRKAHIINLVQAPSQDFHLVQLRGQYSRSLARASVLIWLHTEHSITIGGVPLRRLLNVLHVTSKCDMLNPPDSHSTHHPQSSFTTFDLIVPYGPASGAIRFKARGIAGGLIGDMTRLLQAPFEEQDDSVLQTRIAGIQVFSSLVPIILQQVLGLDRDKLRQELDYSTWVQVTKIDQKSVQYMATRQALTLLRILGPRLPDHPDQMGMISQLLTAIAWIIKDNLIGEAGKLALLEHGAALGTVLESISANKPPLSSISQSTAFNIVNIVRVGLYVGEGSGRDLCDTCLQPDSLILLIRMLKFSNSAESTAEDMLQSVIGRMRNRKLEDAPPRLDIPREEYLYRFTRAAEGFLALHEAVANENYFRMIVDAIVNVTHLAAGRDSRLAIESIELHTLAVPSFLDNMVLVAKYCTENPEHHSKLLGFSLDALDLLDVALKDEESQRRIREHEACGKLLVSLSAIKDSDMARELLGRVDRLMKGLGIAVQESDPERTLAKPEDVPSADVDTQQAEDLEPSGVHQATSEAATRDSGSKDEDHRSENESKQ